MTSIDSPSSWQLATGPSILSALTGSAGGFMLPTVPSCSGAPGVWCPSSSLSRGDAALGWEGWLEGRVSGHRGSPSEDGEPSCLWGQTRPAGPRLQLQSRRQVWDLAGSAPGQGATLAGSVGRREWLTWGLCERPVLGLPLRPVLSALLLALQPVVRAGQGTSLEAVPFNNSAALCPLAARECSTRSDPLS